MMLVKIPLVWNSSWVSVHLIREPDACQHSVRWGNVWTFSFLYCCARLLALGGYWRLGLLSVVVFQVLGSVGVWQVMLIFCFISRGVLNRTVGYSLVLELKFK